MFVETGKCLYRTAGWWYWRAINHAGSGNAPCVINLSHISLSYTRHGARHGNLFPAPCLSYSRKLCAFILAGLARVILWRTGRRELSGAINSTSRPYQLVNSIWLVPCTRLRLNTFTRRRCDCNLSFIGITMAVYSML